MAAIPLAVDGTETVGLSLRDDRIVDGKTRGYVSTLAVRPAWRKRGIALTLLQHTFAEFRRRGYAAVELDIDSQSLTGASRLCDRAGLHAVRQFVTYEKELRPGIDLVTRDPSAQRRGRRKVSPSGSCTRGCVIAGPGPHGPPCHPAGGGLSSGLSGRAE